MKLFTETCSLSDADSDLPRIRGIRVRAVCLMFLQLHNNV